MDFHLPLDAARPARPCEQVFCEGHRLKMQDYIFQQVDNAMSYNLVPPARGEDVDRARTPEAIERSQSNR